MKRYQKITIDSQRTPRSRRILAVVLVACLAVLQCMLLSPALTEKSYAAGDISVEAEYQDDAGTYAAQTLSGSTVSGLKQHSETIKIKDEETGEVVEEYEVSGPELETILGKTGISSKVDKIIVGGYEIKDNWKSDRYFLAIEGGSYNLYEGKNLLVEGVDYIYVKRSSGLKPVSFKSKPASNKTNPTVGDTIKISYKLSVDEFYKKSDGFNMDEATRLTWSDKKKVNLKNKTTTGTSGTVKAVVKKPGAIKIKPKSDSFPELTDNVSVSFTGLNTTTRPTTRTYSGYRPSYTPTRSTYTGGTTRSTTPMTTAPRPSETTQTTMAPSYQTIRVKEVYLMEVYDPVDSSEDQWGEDGGWTEDEWEDDTTDETYDEEDPEDNGVTFPAAAGSAAAALAACGAGAVGRVRRFRLDMGPTADAAVETPAADAPSEPASDGGKKKSDKNPLKKFRRKK